MVLLSSDDEGMDEAASPNVFGEVSDGGWTVGVSGGIGVDADGVEGEIGDLVEGLDGG